MGGLCSKSKTKDRRDASGAEHQAKAATRAGDASAASHAASKSGSSLSGRHHTGNDGADTQATNNSMSNAPAPASITAMPSHDPAVISSSSAPPAGGEDEKRPMSAYFPVGHDTDAGMHLGASKYNSLLISPSDAPSRDLHSMASLPLDDGDAVHKRNGLPSAGAEAKAGAAANETPLYLPYGHRGRAPFGYDNGPFTDDNTSVVASESAAFRTPLEYDDDRASVGGGSLVSYGTMMSDRPHGYDYYRQPGHPLEDAVAAVPLQRPRGGMTVMNVRNNRQMPARSSVVDSPFVAPSLSSAPQHGRITTPDELFRSCISYSESEQANANGTNRGRMVATPQSLSSAWERTRGYRGPAAMSSGVSSAASAVSHQPFYSCRSYTSSIAYPTTASSMGPPLTSLDSVQSMQWRSSAAGLPPPSPYITPRRQGDTFMPAPQRLQRLTSIPSISSAKTGSAMWHSFATEPSDYFLDLPSAASLSATAQAVDGAAAQSHGTATTPAGAAPPPSPPSHYSSPNAERDLPAFSRRTSASGWLDGPVLSTTAPTKKTYTKQDFPSNAVPPRAVAATSPSAAPSPAPQRPAAPALHFPRHDTTTATTLSPPTLSPRSETAATTASTRPTASAIPSLLDSTRPTLPFVDRPPRQMEPPQSSVVSSSFSSVASSFHRQRGALEPMALTTLRRTTAPAAHRATTAAAAPVTTAALHRRTGQPANQLGGALLPGTAPRQRPTVTYGVVRHTDPAKNTGAPGTPRSTTAGSRRSSSGAVAGKKLARQSAAVRDVPGHPSAAVRNGGRRRLSGIAQRPSGYSIKPAPQDHDVGPQPAESTPHPMATQTTAPPAFAAATGTASTTSRVSGAPSSLSRSSSLPPAALVRSPAENKSVVEYSIDDAGLHATGTGSNLDCVMDMSIDGSLAQQMANSETKTYPAYPYAEPHQAGGSPLCDAISSVSSRQITHDDLHEPMLLYHCTEEDLRFLQPDLTPLPDAGADADDGTDGDIHQAGEQVNNGSGGRPGTHSKGGVFSVSESGTDVSRLRRETEALYEHLASSLSDASGEDTLNVQN